MIELVVFDFDGTLVDSMWVWKKVDRIFLKKRNIEVPSNLQKNISGLSFTETAEYFKNKFNLVDSIEKIKKEWIELSSSLYRKKVNFKADVLKATKDLYQKGIKMCVASSNHKELIESYLKQKKINDYFEDIFTGCEFERGKNSETFYNNIARFYRIECKKILFIDDIYESIHAANKAGLKTVGVYDEYTVSDNLKKNSDFFITNFKMLKDIISSFNQ